MTKRHARQYEMLVRVRKFGEAHKELFPEGSEGAKAFGAVAAAIATVDGFNNSKLTGRRDSRKEKLAAKLALATRIGAMARSARVIAKTVPGADAKFPLPTRQSDLAVLQSGRLFVQESEPVKDVFVGCGFPATFVEDLQQAVARLEHAIDRRNAGKTGAAVSQKGIRSTIMKAIDTVQSLDVLVANVLGHDEAEMNAWKRDRHVELAAKSGAIDAPAGQVVSVASSTDQHPIPPAEEAATQPMTSQLSETSTIENPMRPRRAA